MYLSSSLFKLIFIPIFANNSLCFLIQQFGTRLSIVNQAISSLAHYLFL